MPSDNDYPLEPVTGSEYFQRGMELFEQGNLETALEYLDRALQMSHVDADICLAKGQVLVELKRLDDALFWINKAIEFNSQNADVLLTKGRVLHLMRRFRAALSCFNRIIAQDPLNIDAHVNRGLALFELGDLEKACEAFKLAQENHLNSADDRGAEIRYWLARGERALGRTDVAKRHLESLIADSPNYMPAYAELADVLKSRLTSKDELRVVKEVYEKGLKMDPDDPALHNDFGNLLRELGDTEGSIRHLTKAIEINADHEVAYFNRGLTYEELGQYDKALADFRQALRIDTSDFNARLKVTDMLQRLKKFPEAYEEVRVAIAQQPTNNDGLLCAGDLLNRWAMQAEAAGDYATAAHALERLIELAPDLVSVDDVTTPFESAESRHTAAVVGFERLLAHPPTASTPADRLTWSVLLGLHVAKLGDNPRAVSVLQAVVAEAPSQFFAHATMAVPLAELGRPTEGIAHLETALAQRPDYIELLWEKAAILESEPLRDIEGAIRCYEQTLRHPDGDNRWCHEPLARLNEERGEPERALFHVKQYVNFLVDVGQYDSHLVAVEWAIGRLLVALGRSQEAIPHLHRSLDALPATLELDGDVDPEAAANGAPTAGEALAEASNAEAANADDADTTASATAADAAAAELAAEKAEIQADLLQQRVELSLLLGMAYAQIGALNTAIGFLNSVIEKTRDTDRATAVDSITALASIALRQHRLNDAEALLSEADALAPNETRERLLTHALLAFERRQWRAAEEAVTQFLKASPQIDAMVIEALYLDARICFRTGDYATCLARLKELLREEPYFIRAFPLMSWTARALGDLKAAEAADAEFKLAWQLLNVSMLLQTDHAAEAVSIMRSCVASCPDRADVRLSLSAACAMAGRMAEAQRSLIDAVKKDPLLLEDLPYDWELAAVLAEPQTLAQLRAVADAAVSAKQIPALPDYLQPAAQTVKTAPVPRELPPLWAGVALSPIPVEPPAKTQAAGSAKPTAQAPNTDSGRNSATQLSDEELIRQAEEGIDWDSLKD